jgi:hypothetical protein
MGEVVAVIAGLAAVADAVAVDPFGAFVFPSPCAYVLAETTTTASKADNPNNNFVMRLFPFADNAA